MVTEWDKIIDTIIPFFKNLIKPENLSITSFLGLIPLIMYFLNRKNIPKLIFDGFWKQNDYVGINYFVRVKRDKGEGEAEEVKGFVGIKNKFELISGRWINRKEETNISIYDYLGLFKICKQEGNEIITFFHMDDLEPPHANNLYQNYHYTKFKDDELIVKINAKRGRIKDKQFTKKIDDIAKEAKQIPP
jgi:hypothetical protein